MSTPSPTLEERMYTALEKLTPQGKEFVGLYNEYIANLIAQNLLHVMEEYAPRLAPKPHELAPVIRESITSAMSEQLIPLGQSLERLRRRMRHIEYVLLVLTIIVMAIAFRTLQILVVGHL